MTLPDRTIPASGLKYILFRGLSAVASLVPVWKTALRPRLPVATITAFGHRFTLNPKDNRCEYQLWKYKRLTEPKSIALLQNAVRGKCALMYDLGANCGIFSVMIGKEMGGGSRIICFEPNPKMAARLASNLSLNGMIDMTEIHRVALGPEDGNGVLSLGAENLGESTLLSTANGDHTAFKDQIQVPVRPLSTFTDKSGLYETVILKIDIEGFEDKALLSFFTDVDNEHWPNLILIETQHTEMWETDIVETMQNIGYEIIETPEHNTLLRKNTDDIHRVDSMNKKTEE